MTLIEALSLWKLWVESNYSDKYESIELFIPLDDEVDGRDAERGGGYVDLITNSKIGRIGVVNRGFADLEVIDGITGDQLYYSERETENDVEYFVDTDEFLRILMD